MMVWARRPLVAGNWKMNGLRSSAAELSRIIQGAKELGAVDLMLCPPATLIALFAAAVAGSAVRIGAQDCHAEPSGAFTGDLSAEMLRDAGASAIIVGHSERRIHHNETDADVRAKALAARRAGLCAIICVGETRGERENGRALAVVERQLDGSVPDGATAENLVVAYEPVWAIGINGIPATSDYADARQAEIIATAEDVVGFRVPCLYGGSVNRDNCAELIACPHIDGLFIGRAAWAVEGYLDILSRCIAKL